MQPTTPRIVDPGVYRALLDDADDVWTVIPVTPMDEIMAAWIIEHHTGGPPLTDADHHASAHAHAMRKLAGGPYNHAVYMDAFEWAYRTMISELSLTRTFSVRRRSVINRVAGEMLGWCAHPDIQPGDACHFTASVLRTLRSGMHHYVIMSDSMETCTDFGHDDLQWIASLITFNRRYILAGALASVGRDYTFPTAAARFISDWLTAYLSQRGAVDLSNLHNLLADRAGCDVANHLLTFIEGGAKMPGDPAHMRQHPRRIVTRASPVVQSSNKRKGGADEEASTAKRARID